MKRPQSNTDDFDFNFGGGDELFPLNSSDNGSKAPKGVKGYFKNVGKSVINLGVKVNKILLPEVDSLVTQFKDDVSDSTEGMNVKATIKSYKDQVKKFGRGAHDVGANIAKDVKDAAKTGYFVKSSNEDNDLGDSFGDMFSDDGFSFNSSGGIDFGNDDFGIGDDDNGGGKAKLSTTEAVIKAEAASTKATLHMGNKQIAATVGAAQSQIKNQTLMFGQQLEVMQFQHKQKMKVMRNIAINVGKIIEQNNLSLKAQMEYSAKSLAFAQDTAAMIKEMRDATWSMVKPKETAATAKSKHKTIFGSGSGMNFKEYFKHVSGQMSQNSMMGTVFDSFGMVKDMIGPMSEMGMDPTKFISGMIKDMALESGVNYLTGGKLYTNKERLNKQIAGLPTALNRLLGSVGNGRYNDKIINTLSKIPILGKNDGFINFISNKIQSTAELAKVNDFISTSSNKYNMGKPNEVHPFDNKAHWTLTEAIPKFLASIDAGVNHREEMYYDYKHKGLKSISSMKRAITAEKDSILEYSEGYNTATIFTEDSILDSSAVNKFKSNHSDWESNSKLFTNGHLDANKIKDNVKLMFEGFMRSGMDLKPITLEAMKDPDSQEFRSLLALADDLSEYDRQYIANQFVQGLIQLRDNKPDEFRNLQLSAGQYSSKINAMYEEQADKYSQYGSASAYTNLMEDDDILTSIRKNNIQIKKYEKLIESSNSLDKTMGRNKRKKYRESIAKLKEANRELNKYVDGAAGYIKNPEDNSNDNYEFSSLTDTSTNGLVKNIYRLLVEGINVFPQKGNGSRNFYDAARGQIVADDNSSKSRRNDVIKSQYEKCVGEYSIYDSNFTYYEWDDSTNKMVRINRLSEDEFNKNPENYYISKSSAAAKIAREQRDQTRSDFLAGHNDDYTSRIPMLGSIKKVFNTFENFLIGNTGNYIDDKLYGISNSGNANVSKEDVLSSVKDFGSEIKGYAVYKDGKAAVELGLEEARRITTSVLGPKFCSIPLGKDKTVGSVLAKVGDTDLIKRLKSAENFNERVSILKNYSIQEVKDLGTMLESKAKDNTFIQKMNGEMSKLKDKAVDFGNLAKINANRYKDAIKNGAFKSEFGKDLTNLAIKLGANKLDNITVNGVTLKTAIAQMNDPDLIARIQKSKDIFEKTEILLESTNPILAPYKSDIRNLQNELLAVGPGGTSPSKFIVNSIKKSIKNRLKTGVLKLVVPKIKRSIGKDLYKLKVDNVRTVGDIIANIKDPVLMAELQKIKDPIQKAERLITIVETDPNLSMAAAPLRQFIEENKFNDTSLSSTMGFITNKLSNKLHKKVDDFFNKRINKGLIKELFNIEVNGRKLGEVVQELSSDKGLMAELEEAIKKNPVEVANVLLHKDNKLYPSLEPYKAGIRQFAEKYQDVAGKGLSGAGSLALAKLSSAGKKALEWIKKKFLKEKDEGENLLKYVHNDILRVLGDDAVNVLDDAGVEPDTFKAFGSNVIAQIDYLLENCSRKVIKPYKQALKELKKAQKEKQNARKSYDKQFGKFRANFGKKFNIHGVENLSEEQILYNAEQLGLDPEGTKEALAKLKHSKNKKMDKANKRHDEVFKNEDGRDEGSAEDQKKDKEAAEQRKMMKEQNGFFKSMKGLFSKWNKDGIGLDKNTMEGFEGINSALANSLGGDGSGIIGTVQKVMNFGVKAKGAITAFKGAKAAGGIMKGLGAAGKSLLGIGGTAASTAASTAAAGASTAAATAGATAASGAGAAATGATAGGNVLTKIIGWFGKKVGMAPKALGNLCKGISGGLKKCFASVTAKITALTGMSATVVAMAVPLALAAVAFGKGMLDAKKVFKVGKGQSITAGMRLACGAAKALDSLLLGIPSVICNVLGKGDLATWFFELCGSDEDKATIERYKEYNKKRAKIFGIDNPDGLIDYENHNGLDRAGRVMLQILTFGIADSNDEKEAKMLGFKHVKIFKYWKDNKYEPLDKMRDDVAASFGNNKKGKPLKAKDFEEFISLDVDAADEDGDGEIDDDNEKAKQQLEAMQNQQRYRIAYLKAARDYVINHNLAWLTTHCTPEEFEKYTGKNAGSEMATSIGGKIKQQIANSPGMKAVRYAQDAAKYGVVEATRNRAQQARQKLKQIAESSEKLFEKIFGKRKTNDARDSHDEASSLVQDIWESADPNYYGNLDTETGTNVKTENGGNSVSGDPSDARHENGGVGGSHDNAINVIERVNKIDPAKTRSSINSASGYGSPATIKNNKRSYVKNSQTEAFIEAYNKEICEKLNILQEIRDEALRHNQVSEQFFTSALNMMQLIAKKSGNTSMASKMDEMVRMVTS